MPALVDTGIAGRQKVIARIGMVMRELAKSGKLEQQKPGHDGTGSRATCRYMVVDADA
jgi:hypothetical protein